MAKLVVLAERNILPYLNSIGVYPYEFYTDIKTFKRRTPLFEDIKLVIIFAGTCGFSKRYVVRLANLLVDRAENEDDIGLVSVTILSDTFLPQCKCYYKYTARPIDFLEYSGWNLVSQEPVDIWGTLEYSRCSEPASLYLRTPVTAEEVRRGMEGRTDYTSIIKIPEILG